MKSFAAVLALIHVAIHVQASPSNIHEVRASQEVHAYPNERPSIEGLQTAAGVAASLVAVMTQEYSSAICCNQTPCFIGCPVNGIPRVSFHSSCLPKIESLTC